MVGRQFPGQTYNIALYRVQTCSRDHSVYTDQQSREILALLSQLSLFLAIYGVWVSGTQLNLVRDSVDRTSMAAHMEKPETSLYIRAITGYI